MMLLSQLKAILALAGINNLSVKFDAENKQILADFDYHGQPIEKKIPFEDIEASFTDGSGTNAKASNLADLKPTGS